MDELTRLAVEARSGVPGAAEGFVCRAYPEVVRLCGALVDREAAPDLAQETFARALRSLRRFREEASARTWLLSIAHRVSADEIRARTRRRREQRIMSEDAGRHDATRAPDPTQEHGVRALVGELEPGRRAAFVLTQMLGLPYAEAAEVCGCPPGTIRSRVFRARMDLIAWLAEDEAEPRPGAAN
jgi:RNA polymerase sigma-70 factor (ECF subfamily)